jgi:Protein of unknown function (DUF3551)
MKKITILGAAAIGTMMTRPDRPIASLTIALALATIFLLTSLATPSPARAAGAPPFCVLQGGSNGPGSTPQVCAYYDYQVCLQAAADLRGNCVQNIDYHGEVSSTRTPARTQRRHRY